ncbi:MAG: circadian clock KaiB family protein [Myxococcales bacterium]|nr:circadian clock KaiB family protein [Myxococcales bacterium]
MPTPPIDYRFRLYVAGGAARSRRAVEVISRLCAARLPGCVAIDVIDVHREPQRALDDGIFGVPALVRVSPPPVRRLVGDLSDETRVSSVILELSA